MKTTYNQSQMKKLLLTIIAICLLTISAQATKYYLYTGSDPWGTRADGTKVSVAAGTIHTVLNGYAASDVVWIANGTYATTTSPATIALKAGMEVYGGFYGNETSLSQRQLKDETGGNGIAEPWEFKYPTIITGAASSSYSMFSNATYFILDGLTIQNHTATALRYGGGIYCSLSSSTFANLVINKCTIRNINKSHDGTGGVTGGGSAIYVAGNATISSCLVENNVLAYTVAGKNSGYGGSVCTAKGVSITGCIIRNNSCNGNTTYPCVGGGIVLGGATDTNTALVANNVIYNNTAATGGAIYIAASTSTSTIVNNTIVNNLSLSTGNSSYSSGIAGIPANAKIYNNVLFNNQYALYSAPTSYTVRNLGSLVTVDIQNCAYNGGAIGTGSNYTGANNNNALTTPNFVSSSSFSTPGYASSMSTDVKSANFAILSNSGDLYNAGAAFSGVTQNTDLLGNTCPNGTYDIGAYEYYPRSVTLSPTTLTNFTYGFGAGPSSEKTFTVSGQYLGSDITITPSTNYEVSATTGTGFQSSVLTISQTIGAGVPTTTIYVRLKAGLAANSYNSENVAVDATGLTTQNVTCSGTVVPALTKLANPTNLSSGTPTASSFTGSWDAVPNASSYDVKILTYPANVQVGSTYNVSGTSKTVTGLNYSTAYTFTVTAKGNNLTTSDSDPASATNFTMAALTVLSTPTTSAATNFTANGFTANWNTVSNASSYDVKFYLGTTLQGTTNVSGQASSSLVKTGLTAGLNYNYTVTAKGDNIDYADSPASTASTAYTSATPALSPLDIRPTSFTAYWTPTSSSTNYTVKLYQGGDLLSTDIVTLSGTGASAASLKVYSGLKEGLPYSFTVTTSDGITTAESTFTTMTPTIVENFQDWTPDQSAVGTYSITKKLYDGVTNGTFAGTNMTVLAAQSIGSKGSAIGNANPSLGRITCTGSSNNFDLPVLTNIGRITLKAYGNSDGNGFKLQSSSDGSTFTDIVGATIYLSGSAVGGVNVNLTYNTTTYIRFKPLNGSGNNIYDLQVNPMVSASKLTTPTVGVASAITSTGFTANWSTSTNALGYYVKVYQGASLISTSYADGQGTTSLAITGLSANTSYTYKVIAKGNVTSYASSDASTASASFICISGNFSASALILTPSSSITVASGGLLTIDQNTELNSVTVQPNGKLTISDTKSLTVGSLNLQSDVNGTATLVDINANGGLTVSGTTTVQQYLSKSRNWYVTTPVTSATATVVNPQNSTNLLYWYDESKGSPAGWTSVTSNSTSLTPGLGYIVKPASDGVTLNFTGGSLNTGTSPSLTIYRTSAPDHAGFSLIGNPYPSYLNARTVINSSVNLDKSIWYRTQITNSTTYKFDTYNTASGQYINASGNNTYIVGTVPPMQAFWVRVSSGQSSANVNFSNSYRTHATADTLNPLKVKNRLATAQPSIRLKVSNGVNSDETLLYTDPSATNGYDSYDSQKMTNSSSAIPELYTIADNQQLAINGLNSLPYDTELPLGFITLSAGTFSIKASQINNFVAGTQLILKDYADVNNPVVTDLSDGSSYSFSSDATTNNTSRFVLIFRASQVATGITPANENNAWISVSGGKISINGNLAADARLDVFNALGQKIQSSNLTANQKQLNTRLLPVGAYLVSITNDGKTSTRKIIVD